MPFWQVGQTLCSWLISNKRRNRCFHQNPFLKFIFAKVPHLYSSVTSLPGFGVHACKLILFPEAWEICFLHLLRFPYFMQLKTDIKKVHHIYFARYKIDYGIKTFPSTNILLGEFSGHSTSVRSSSLVSCKESCMWCWNVARDMKKYSHKTCIAAAALHLPGNSVYDKAISFFTPQLFRIDLKVWKQN